MLSIIDKNEEVVDNIFMEIVYLVMSIKRTLLRLKIWMRVIITFIIKVGKKLLPIQFLN